MHNPTDRIAHTTVFVTPVVERWLDLEIAQWVHHEQLIHPMTHRTMSEHSYHCLMSSFIKKLYKFLFIYFSIWKIYCWNTCRSQSWHFRCWHNCLRCVQVSCFSGLYIFLKLLPLESASWATFRPTKLKTHYIAPQFFNFSRTVQIAPKYPSLKCTHIYLLA